MEKLRLNVDALKVVSFEAQNEVTTVEMWGNTDTRRPLCTGFTVCQVTI